ncbi:MAG: anaerobic ribonucleoside-triphosphate reductase activating protein [Alphaproteobacteria bacterium]|jgi:anaerobic ribonucleoside-triphosphate reductase activating protein|nr:anaerobic ribonucleoside-triphosphate reductase activating protein [Alphaproteobacteria bacterium]
MELKIAGREPNSIVDGLGMRYVIFFQGCPHHCHGCHNMETWNIKGGISSSIENEINLIEKYIGYIDGITISGGDPFFQYENLLALTKAIKQAYNLNIWVYTGYTLEEIQSNNMSEGLDYIDVLVDGKFIQSQKSPKLPFVGSSNQRVIRLR